MSYPLHIVKDLKLCSLMEGNRDFVNNPKYKQQRLLALKGQNPCAIVISCSDSRLPPEIVFQQLNLGDIFVIRTAGGTLSQCDLDSIKYAVEILKTHSIIILGHSGCGAVQAVWNNLFHTDEKDEEDHNPNNVQKSFPCIYKYVKPSCTKHSKLTNEQNINVSVKNNVVNTNKYLVKKLNKSGHYP